VVVVTTVVEPDLVELLLEVVDREEEGRGIRVQDGLGRWMIFEVLNVDLVIDDRVGFKRMGDCVRCRGSTKGLNGGSL